MTPDRYDYHPCPTCGVLAPEGRPHPATFCARERPVDEPYAIGLPQSARSRPVTVDDPALWGGEK